MNRLNLRDVEEEIRQKAQGSKQLPYLGFEKELIKEVKYLRKVIERAYKGCNHPATIKILRDALNGED